MVQVDIFCNNVTYGVSGMAWGVADYQHYTDQNVNCAAQGMAWVMVPSDQFYTVYGAYLSGSGAVSNPSPSSASSPFTESEISALKLAAASPNPLNLSLEDAGLIFGLIAVVWASAWGIRSVIRAVNSDSASGE